ncbi:hypothetical protein LUZ60_001285 [Juncus effusus]|nr:hypothetical protein LUZ60_001285 [Juncus effusus]
MHSSFLYLLLLFLHLRAVVSIGKVAVEYIYPNYSVSSLLFISSNGMFLTSRNGTFQAAVYKPGTQQSRYYFSILHAATQTVVWTANRDIPMPDRDSTVNLTPKGLNVAYSNYTVIWSTPSFNSPVYALRLLDTGNMLLLDESNSTLWQSFDHPSDTLVSSQLLPTGSYISSSVSADSDFSEGDYRLNVTSADVVLNWLGSSYWRLSNDVNSIKNKDAPVAFLTTNDSGLYLLASNGDIVFQVTLQSAPFRILQLDSAGQLEITSYATPSSSTSLGGSFVVPSSSCDLPLSCGSFGLCSLRGNSSSCTCPQQFASSAHSGGCTPANGMPLASNSSCGKELISYSSLGIGVTYFANKFRTPDTSGRNRSDCEALCSSKCICLGYVFDTSSQSCFLLQQPLGSLINENASVSTNSMAYAKIQISNQSPSSTNSSSNNIVAILSPSIAAFVLVLVVGGASIMWWRRKQKKKIARSKSSVTRDMLHGSPSGPLSDSDYLFSEKNDDIDEILIPGLPTRFTFQQLVEITNNFRTKIGSGGFGSVYKGELFDKSLVAVKKIEAVGVHGRKEFCTEIAVIGNIHHVNLVRLRGFCAQSSHRLLVYEYMNRGSLDRSLFHPVGSLLDWSERMNVAIGSARGLAYLHSGCQPKIVHCDVKPENILLNEEGQVKIADFGLAKLMTADQSGMFTTMRGTRGYLAPEWLTNTAISDRTDVYSFGMVLLELIQGRKNRKEHVSHGESIISETLTDSASKGNEYFPLVALEKHEQKSYADLADARLEGKVDVSEVERMVKTALCCLHEDPAYRPSMTTIVAMLEGTMQVWEPRVESLVFLKLYGRGYLGASSAGTLEIDDEKMKKMMVGSNTSTATSSGWPSYMSSQDLSGPR